MDLRARRFLNLLVVLSGSVLVWQASAELPWPARALTTLLLVVLPAGLLVQVRFRDEVPDGMARKDIYLSSIIGILVMAAVAVLAARASGFTWYRLGFRVPGWSTGVAALLTTAAGLGVVGAVRALRVPEGRLVAYMLPRTAAERALFVGVSLAAGVGEELTFRSFLIPAVESAAGDAWLAAGLSAGAFGLIHSYQGALGAIRAGLLGFVLAVPFVVTGSVVPSMVAHTVLDIVLGFWLADWAMRV